MPELPHTVERIRAFPLCADDLLEQFLESFPEEPPVVQLALVTAAVKLFLKRPAEKPQQLIQLVLTYATQVSTQARETLGRR